MIVARRRVRTTAAAAASADVRLARFRPGGMLSRELLVTAARPRALAIKMVMPLVLTLPLLLGRAPVFWAATLLTVLVAMTGAVGSAVTLARAHEAGLLGRLALVPRPAARTVGAWVVAGVIMDATQLAPALLAIGLLGRGAAADGAVLLLAAVGVLVITNVLGCLVSLLAGGPGEVLLDTAVLLAPLLFLAGLFTGVPATGWRHLAAAVDPFSGL
ncbi:MAG: hypothetical protein ABR541_04790, partial [Candidatus Dormibacteria bacterium]